MNSKIQDLIKQVGTDVSGKWISVDNVNAIAELIVQECAEVVKWTPSMFPNDAIIKNIKEHFGVEEPKGWICPKCNADRTKIACPLGFGATVDGRCPMTVEAQ